MTNQSSNLPSAKGKLLPSISLVNPSVVSASLWKGQRPRVSVKDFNQALAEMKKDGTYDSIWPNGLVREDHPAIHLLVRCGFQHLTLTGDAKAKSYSSQIQLQDCHGLILRPIWIPKWCWPICGDRCWIDQGHCRGNKVSPSPYPTLDLMPPSMLSKLVRQMPLWLVCPSRMPVKKSLIFGSLLHSNILLAVKTGLVLIPTLT